MRPSPDPDALTQGFWDACARGELCVLRCLNCGTYLHQPTYCCSHCAGRSLDWKRVSGLGRVYSWIVVHQASLPGFAEEVPYVVGAIELDEQAGLRVIARVVGCEPFAVREGLRVRVEFERLASGAALPAFRPDPGAPERPREDRPSR